MLVRNNKKFKANLLNGISKTYYENGQLKEEVNYKDGQVVLNSLYSLFHIHISIYADYITHLLLCFFNQILILIYHLHKQCYRNLLIQFLNFLVQLDHPCS